MVEPRAIEDDELVPDLAPLENGLPTEENYQPDNDDDLGLDDEAEGGLDADIGPLDTGEPEVIADDDERSSWLDDGAAVETSDPDDDLDSDDDDESRWTDGSEPNTTDADGWDDDLVLDDAGGSADNGEEGFRDESFLAGLELDRLPPLERGEPEAEELESDVLASELIEPLMVADDAEDARDAPRETFETLERFAEPPTQLVAAPSGALLWAAGLWTVERTGRSPVLRGEPAGPLLAAAIGAAGDASFAALATPAGLFTSDDLGHGIRRAGGAGLSHAVASLAVGFRGASPRVFAANAGGPLFVSDDRGEHFVCLLPEARVLRIAGDGAAALLVFGRKADSPGAASALLSLDAGAIWHEIALPVTEPERVQELQVAGEHVLCCRRSPQPQLLVRRADGGWSELAEGAAAPALLLRESGEAAVYFWSAGKGRTRLMRAPQSAPHKAVAIATLPADAGVPLLLRGAHRHGTTTLYVGCERALLRVAIAHAGSAR